MDNFLQSLTNGIDHFIGLFKAGGTQFVGLVTGILPTLIVLMVAINSIIKLIGEKRVDKFAEKMSKYVVSRYLILPFLGVFCLANPMCYTFGRFLKEEHKAGYYDAAVSFVHPITGLFPHANPGELFVWLGISAGLTTLGQSVTKLALFYFLTGLIVIVIRGFVTERVYKYLVTKSKQ